MFCAEGPNYKYGADSCQVPVFLHAFLHIILHATPACFSQPPEGCFTHEREVLSEVVLISVSYFLSGVRIVVIRRPSMRGG